MRIPCPFCGVRSRLEFTVRGEAGPARPDPAGPGAGPRFEGFVYERENPAGVVREHWRHSSGCRRWLLVTRDTRTHEVLEVSFAGEGG